MENAHCIWGGRFCPIIPVDNSARARQLVETFDVDALFPMTDDALIQQFLSAFSFRSWPFFHQQFWVESGGYLRPQLLSVEHPLRFFSSSEGRLRRNNSPAVLFDWEDTDPLSLWFSAAIGKYPQAPSGIPDFRRMYLDAFTPLRLEIKRDSQAREPGAITPNTISSFDLYLDQSNQGAGVYVSEKSDFANVVNFWNLRASGPELSFYVVSESARLQNSDVAELMRQSPSLRGELTVFSQESSLVDSLGLRNVYWLKVDSSEWRFPSTGQLEFRSARRRSTLASIDYKQLPPRIALPMPEKPCSDEHGFYSEHLIANVSSYGHIFEEGDYVFPPPPVKPLNDYFSREILFGSDKIRVSGNGAGFVVGVTDELLQFNALTTLDFFQKMFALVGIKLERSRPGLIAHRLLKQMGGLQGCRVFKIPGVRDLIEKYKPRDSFVYSDAILTIRGTGGTGFQPHETLYLEPRKEKRLKPEDAFEFLLKKGVFRAGLELICPHCELPFWKHIDSCETLMPCDLCGNVFNITPQLRHRGDWRFRRSGLFGSDDNQGGSIPVGLTLQQLDTILRYSHGGPIAYSTSVLLEPTGAAIDSCEADFIISSTTARGDVEVAIAECKSKDEISEKDVANLSKVAKSLAAHGFHAYMIFSKTGTFSVEEVNRCKQLGSWDHGGVILLSGRELEPYDIYQYSEGKLEKQYANSFSDLVAATKRLFF